MTIASRHARLRLPLLVAAHLALTACVAALFAWQFGHNPRAVAAHVLLIAEWDAAVIGMLYTAAASASSAAAWPSWLGRVLVTLTGTLQGYLYALNAVSNLSWNRNMTAHLVSAFAPTVWSGREPFPIGPVGITLCGVGVIVAVAGLVATWERLFVEGTDAWLSDRGDVAVRRRQWVSPLRLAVAAGAAILVSRATASYAVASQDNLYWKQELIASFFRPDGFAFEPTARRHAVAERDAVLRASYPRLSAARRKHVVLVIIDSLRADRMEVYGYRRPTTPFLSSLVRDGRMKRVEAAFSTCSESFCGITSTLASREFRDISARTFQLQDVLRDEGYRTWFLLSGNHSAWNGLPQFYRADADTFFDGSKTQRYTMDDDRLVLEGLEHVPPASGDQPAFFYVHLMSTHYLGVQLPDSHVFTSPDDRVSPGLEPYKILERLNKPDRYDDKVLQADRIVRRLFEALEAKHYLEDAIVVVTGDHGEGLGERHWAHGWHLYDEDIRIPMLFYDAPAANYPDLTFGTQVDIAPTILDRLGLPIPESWEGQSLLAPTRTRFTLHQTYFLPNRFAVLYRRDAALYKFIATPQYGKEELYDLTLDRGEVHNLVDQEKELSAMLREKVSAYRRDDP